MIVKPNSCLKKISCYIIIPVSPSLYFKSIRRKSFYTYKYNPQVESAVNVQIQTEQQAAQDYLNIAVAFLHPSLSRPGAGGFFMRMYEEELGHMQDLIQYQLLRGGVPVINSISAPTPNMNITLHKAFCKALEMEKAVTECLESIVSTAETVKDWQCADYITTVYLAEQMKSINNMSHHITQLSRLNDEHSIYHYDLELARNCPYTFKTKPG